MRIVLAGASGFLGAACLRELVNRGHSVTIIDRHGLEPDRLRDLEVDRIDAAKGFAHPQFIEALRQIGADAILNLAWQGVANFARNEGSQFENVAMHLALARATMELGIRNYVAAGSQAEYGPTEGPVSETQLLRPTTMYGAAKSAAGLGTRALLLDSDTSFTWVRIFSLYGPGDASHWMIPSTARKLINNESVNLTLGTQLWDYLYICDAARAFAAILEQKRGLEFVNLGSGKPVAIRNLVEELKHVSRSTSSLNFGAVDFRRDQVMHLEANISKLKFETGWVPEVSISEGLAKTVQSLRNIRSDV